jgi:hypothetical protein
MTYFEVFGGCAFDSIAVRATFFIRVCGGKLACARKLFVFEGTCIGGTGVGDYIRAHASGVLA